MALTPLAHAYREKVKKVIAGRIGEMLVLPTDKECVYGIELKVYFDKLENPGWFELYTKGANKGERKAQSRYKALDVDNRVKFLQDCVTTSLGIPNDSQFFREVQEKHEDPNDPHVDVMIYVETRDRFFKTRR